MQKIKNKIKSQNQIKKLLYNNIPIKVVDLPRIKVDINLVLSKIEQMIPYHLLSGYVDEINFGNFDFFKKNNFNAFYDKENKIIFIRSEEQDNNIDLFDDLVHEISHAIEDKYNKQIFLDGKINAEFIHKRLKLKYSLMLRYGNQIPSHKFMLTKYNKEIDDLFHKIVGYEKMKMYTKNIFPSAYAPTSVSEYWAEGFEKYCLGEKEDLFRMCPQLFNKIDLLFKGENNEDYKKYT